MKQLLLILAVCLAMGACAEQASAWGCGQGYGGYYAGYGGDYYARPIYAAPVYVEPYYTSYYRPYPVYRSHYRSSFYGGYPVHRSYYGGRRGYVRFGWGY